MKAVCALAPRTTSSDAARVAASMRRVAEELDRGDAVETRLSRLRRTPQDRPNAGNGIRWSSHDLAFRVCSWASPVRRLEIAVEGGPHAVRLRHPMPANLGVLRDRAALARHLRRIAALADAAAPDDDPRTARLVSVLDSIGLAAAALASAEDGRPNRPLVRFAAPSPFAREGRAWGGDAASGLVVPSPALMRLLSRRVPTMVGLSRSEDQAHDAYEMDAIGVWTRADPVGPVDLLRARRTLAACDGEPLVRTAAA